MQNVDSATLGKKIERKIRDEAEVVEIYFSAAGELALNAELVLIERDVMDEKYEEAGLSMRSRLRISKKADRLAAKMAEESQKNYLKAENHRRRCMRLMSRYDALLEG